MMILLRIFVALYGGLTLAAMGEEVKSLGFKFYHLIYLICSLSLLAYAYRPEWLNLLYLGLAGLIILALYIGISQNILAWSHILIRLLISIAIIYFNHRLTNG